MQHKLISVLDGLDFQRPGHLVGLGTAIAATGLLSVYGYQKIITIKERRRLSILTKRKQAERADALAQLKADYELTPRRQHIVDTPTDDLIEKLQYRTLSAKEVLIAFIAKAVKVTEELNCVTEFIPQALAWAEKLDALPAVKGPLHGLPFCVKDDHAVKGMDTTLGYAKFLYQPEPESAAIVKVLRDLGGIPFCKTNIPQSIYSWGSDNPIFGTTINSNFPERRLGPGGSSSGTAALVGAGGAVFGLGSDTGGSGRIPAHCNGISSIKPTNARICKKGVGMKVLAGSVGVYGTPALMAPLPKHLTLIFKAITEGNVQRKYDGTVAPVAWNSKMNTSHDSLRIGYYTSLSTFPACGSTQQTMLNAKAALEARGHVLVPFEIPSNEKFQWTKLFSDMQYANRGEGLKRLDHGEEISRATRHLHHPIVNGPYWLRRLLSTFLYWIPVPRVQKLVASLRMGFDADTGAKLWKCIEKRDALVEEVLSSMNKLHLDLIICPTFPFPALGVEDHHQPELFGACSYTCFWNLVDMPAGVVRFGTETGEGVLSLDDKADSAALRIIKKALPQSIGMPIGVQVVGKRFEEELVLRLMNELDESYQMEKAQQ